LLFYLLYNIALLTFAKELALISKKTSFIHSLQARARKIFSLPERADGVTGYSVHLYSDKANCFNQSERAFNISKLYLTNKKAKTVLCSVIKHARK